MAPKSRYWQLCSLSGFVWGLIAIALLRPRELVMVGGALIVAPLIGLVVGAVARPWIRTHIIWLAYGALFDLYLASALFSFAIGLYSWCVGRCPKGQTFVLALGDAWEAAIASPIGITRSFYVVFLWPLAVVNHRWLARFTAESR